MDLIAKNYFADNLAFNLYFFIEATRLCQGGNVIINHAVEKQIIFLSENFKKVRRLLKVHEQFRRYFNHKKHAYSPDFITEYAFIFYTLLIFFLFIPKGPGLLPDVLCISHLYIMGQMRREEPAVDAA